MIDLLHCKCVIKSCEENSCESGCSQGAHIICTCPRECKIPVLELLFIKDQRSKVKRGSIIIGGIDKTETARLKKKSVRLEKEENNLRNTMEKQEAEQSHMQGLVDLDLLLEASDQECDEHEEEAECVGGESSSSSQNRLDLTNLAQESLRTGASVRMTASLATALLIDLKMVTKEDSSLIIDTQKVQRAREKVMRTERIEANEEFSETELSCIFYDAR